MYQHDVIILRGTSIWTIFCDQCSFSAEYNGSELKINSVGDITVRHKGIYFEVGADNIPLPVYYVEQIEKVIQGADKNE
jgi:hypothetical protein